MCVMVIMVIGEYGPPLLTNYSSTSWMFASKVQVVVSTFCTTKMYDLTHCACAYDTSIRLILYMYDVRLSTVVNIESHTVLENS